jgi:hypothetical protein
MEGAHTKRRAWLVAVAVASSLTGMALVACGAPVGPTLVDVEGTVRRFDGSGAVGRSVAIGDAPVATTDENGAFRVEDVAVPYDLVVFSEAEGRVDVFVGVSTSSPDVIVGGSTPVSSVLFFTASVAGTLPAAVGPGRLAVVCVESLERPVAGCDELSPGESTFDVAVGWMGAPSLTATVRAIVYEVDAEQLPTGIASMGVASVALADGAAVTGVGVPLTAIASGTVDVQIAVPAGWSPATFRAATRVSGDGELHVAPASMPSATAFTVALPTTGVGEHVLVATASDGASFSLGWTGPVAAAGQLERLVLLAPPAQVAPSTGATGVPATAEFRVDDRPGTANVFVVEPVAAGSGPRVSIVTLEPVATLPDLADLDPGLAIASGASYEWGVLTVHGVDDGPAADVAVAGGPLADYAAASLAVAFGFGPVPDVPGAVTQSSVAPFTFE